MEKHFPEQELLGLLFDQELFELIFSPSADPSDEFLMFFLSGKLPLKASSLYQQEVF